MRERHFLLMTLSLIILVGAPSVYSMIQEPTPVRRSSEAGGRLPASVIATPMKVDVASEVSHRNSIKARSVTMDYDCQKPADKNPSTEVDGNLFRLTSSTCLSDKWTNVSVVNKTNGFTASVIFLKTGFTTDFMDLNEGENTLSLTAVSEKGEPIERLLKIKRRTPAAL